MRRYKSVYASNVAVIFVTTLLGASVIGFFGDAILGVFGRDFSVGKTVLRILMCSTVFEGIAIALYQHLQAQEKMWSSLLMINIPRETAFIVLAFILVPRHGAIGLSLAYALCCVLTLLVVSVLVCRERIAKTPT